MILKILKYPEPVLSQPGEPVTEFDVELRKFVADLFETTYASQGIGLAAPQVGVSKRITVIDVSMGKDPKDKLVLINPEIIFSEGKLYAGNEEGKFYVFEAGREYKKLAENQFPDGFMASPAVSGNSLYLRSKTTLYRFDP